MKVKEKIERKGDVLKIPFKILKLRIYGDTGYSYLLFTDKLAYRITFVLY